MWTGEWGSGSIDVPGLSRYTIFLLKIQGSLTRIIAIRYSTAFRGIGGWISGNNLSTYAITATVDGDRLTMTKCASVNHVSNGSHGAIYDQTVQEIAGIV